MKNPLVKDRSSYIVGLFTALSVVKREMQKVNVAEDPVGGSYKMSGMEQAYKAIQAQINEENNQ
jgi:hypothetical protein